MLNTVIVNVSKKIWKDLEFAGRDKTAVHTPSQIKYSCMSFQPYRHKTQDSHDRIILYLNQTQSKLKAL